jgi:hypothetical protein
MHAKGEGGISKLCCIVARRDRQIEGRKTSRASIIVICLKRRGASFVPKKLLSLEAPRMFTSWLDRGAHRHAVENPYAVITGKVRLMV